ncbi:hypothetical protein [Flectobacillus major]|uniref:hypothetical protein n=1 Tax=Flectobacillus major TaxID=103 RepID=UPI00042397BE|nr:hypothetical protein [Flectobacillus major]
MKKLIILTFANLFLWACSKDSGVSNELSGETADNQKLEQLGVDVQDFAKNKACSGDDCRVIPMGAKACGGPTQYLVYSVSKVDEKLLVAKVQAYTDFQKELNKKYNRMSDCMILSPPVVNCVNGLCTAQ